MKQFNQQQLQAIECTKNCIVSAGAGSGKTEVLTNRFIRLVKEKKAHCDQILAMTFTIKATSEMKSRIHQALLDQNLTEELKRFSDASISTVDSFTTSIVKSDCTRYGLASDFTIFDENDFENLATKTAQQVIENCINDKAVEKIISDLGLDNLISMLVAIAKDHTSIINSFDPEKTANYVLEYALSSFDKNKKELVERINFFVNTMQKEESQKENIQTLNNVLDALDKNNFEVFKKFKLNVQKGNKSTTEFVKEARVSFINLGQSLFMYYDMQNDPDFIKGLYCFIGLFMQKINDAKLSVGKLTFSDVMELSIDILLTNITIRKKYKEKYLYIMVDEFQDNNDSYRKLIYLLAEDNDVLNSDIPRADQLQDSKVFLVGDQKQSIYRFRGADVSVFKGMEKDIPNQIELETNYRSTKTLVKAFNSIFSSVMENQGQAYEADFKELGYQEKEPVQSKIIFNNYVHPSKHDSKRYDFECATQAQSEAYSIAQLIKQMLSTDDYLIEKDNKIQRPSESDIAILFKSSTHQSDYEKALKLQNIRYSVAEAKALTTEALFNDFYSVLQLAVYPYDQLSWAAFLKSPFCAVKDDELKQIDLNNIPEYYQKKIQTVRQKLEQTCLTQTLDFIFYQMGYRAFLISNQANQVYVEQYDYLYALALDFEKRGQGVSEFLDYLRFLFEKPDKMKKLTVFQEQSDGVRIMTIHKSKGLGFPIVIVAGMNNALSNKSKGFCLTKNNGFLFVNCAKNVENKLVNPVAVDAAQEEKNKEIAELKRLFYVAATRAKYHIVFSASIEDSSLTEKSSTISMVKMLINATQFDFNTQKSPVVPVIGNQFTRIEVEKTFSKVRFNKATLDKVMPWYQNASQTNINNQCQSVAVTSLCKQEIKDINATSLSSLNSDKIIAKHQLYTQFGTFVHQFIQKKISKLSINPVFSCEAELSQDEIDQITVDAQKLSDNFVKSCLFDSMILTDLYCEREFYIYRDNILINGVIDLLSLTDELAMIIDFKTDQYKNPQQHTQQLDYYVQAVKEIYPDKKVCAYLFYLRDPDNPVQIV